MKKRRFPVMQIIAVTVAVILLCVVTAACDDTPPSPEESVPAPSDISASSTQPSATTVPSAPTGTTTSPTPRSTGTTRTAHTTVTARPVSPTTAPTTAPRTTTATKPTAPSRTFESIADEAPLSPMKTDASRLDALVDGVFGQIFTPEMTPAQKLRACYDYIAAHTAPAGEHLAGTDDGVCYVSAYDRQIIDNAYTLLSTGAGRCDDAAAAFAVMSRRIGFESYLVSGNVTDKSGAQTPHAWAIIKIGGVVYLFDPCPASGEGTFGKTYADTGNTYAYDGGRYYNMTAFRNFLHYPEDIVCTVTISAADGSPAVSRTLGHQGDEYPGLMDMSHFSRVRAVDFDVRSSRFHTGTDGKLTVELSATGGSGKYIVRLYKLVTDGGATSDILLREETMEGAHTVAVDLHRDGEPPYVYTPAGEDYTLTANPTDLAIEVQDAATDGTVLEFLNIYVYSDLTDDGKTVKNSEADPAIPVRSVS